MVSLACTSHKLVDVGAYGDAGLCYQLDTVFGYGGYGWRVDYLRVDGSLHGLEHVAARQVYGRGLFKRQVDVGFRCRNQGMYHALHMSARHVVGFQIVAGDVLQAGLMGLDEARHDDTGRHVADAHQEELYQRDAHARYFGGEPKEERYEMKEYRQKDDGDDGDDHRKKQLDLIT